MNIFRHLHTINRHRFLVMKMCFQCGMYRQGLLHDLSKYSLEEFVPSVKYFQGYRSPYGKEKELKGYSEGWLHHKGRNKHHWEYWVDRTHGQTQLVCIKMPINYLLESVLDRIAASKVYNGSSYTDSKPLDFFQSSKEYHVMNQENAKEIEELLKYLKENGEKKALAYYRDLYKHFKQGLS
ncbi:MAG: catalase [Erysipelotrichaceae bacterium]|nr:catalase [Erysipelotrichaceae bacterium]